MQPARAVVGIGDTNYEVTWWDPGLPFLAFTFAYWAVAEGTLGTTLGKWVTGLRVTDLQGRRISIGRASTRWLLLFLDGPFTAFICGAMLSNSTNGHQRLGDRFSDSYVIDRKYAGKPLLLPE
ncbi:MAG: RDD family protein [Acidimicrobiia bacterium]